MIESMLKQFDAWLQMYRPSYYAQLKEPWGDTQFTDMEVLSGVPLPGYCRDLFRWKGGQSAMTSQTLFADWRFLQFEEIRIEYQTYNELLEMGEFQQKNWWRQQWLPFLINTRGTLMCIDLSGAFGGRAGQLVTFEMKSPNRSIEFPHLYDFIASLMDSCRRAQEAGRLLDEPIEVPSPPGYPIAKLASEE